MLVPITSQLHKTPLPELFGFPIGVGNIPPMIVAPVTVAGVLTRYGATVILGKYREKVCPSLKFVG